MVQIGCRAMLRTRRFSFPAADLELLHSFYPFIMNFMLEVQIQDPNEPDGDLPFDMRSLMHPCVWHALLARGIQCQFANITYTAQRIAQGKDGFLASLVVSAKGLFLTARLALAET
jgi:hypothetical protein